MAQAVLAPIKIRTRPEEFRVQEVTSLQPSGGAYAVYLMTKRSIGTLEAIERICRRWRLPGRRVGYGGLKDRHALTDQYITILRGPKKHLTLPGIKLLYLGQAPERITSRHVLGNRFEILVRGIDGTLREHMESRLHGVRGDGFPNYFGYQRFGSVGVSGEFIAKAWMQGDYERALWLALAEESPSDSAREREQKEQLRRHWRDWATCCEVLARSHRRSIVFYLRDHPEDFRGAFARLRRDLRALYLSAYQSYLWNEVVCRFLERRLADEQRLELRLRVGRLVFPTEFPEELRTVAEDLAFPLPSARIEPQGEYGAILAEVLAEEGLELRQLRSRHIRDVFFARAKRRVFVRPQELSWTWEEDEGESGRFRVWLRFFLPAGSYATVLLQSLTVLPVRGRAGAEG